MSDGGGKAVAAGFDKRQTDEAEVIPVRERLREKRRQGGGERQGIEKRTIEVGGLERTYYIYTPESASRGQAPLVVAFHGGGQTAQRFAQGVGLREMADRYGFVIALPEGVGDRPGGGGSWNTGSAVPQGYAETSGVDDLGFVAAILDQMMATGRIDPKRVFAMGVSKGGMMSYNAACNLPGRFAAIAVVAGTLPSGECADPEGVSLLHIHGTDDKRVPFEGGQGEFSARGAQWESALDGILHFAKEDACGSNWTSKPVAEDTTCKAVSCPGSGEVQYCLVEGGGHTWPGVETTRRQQRQGAYSSPYFDATEYIAEFFLRH